jgi:transcriptional regulator with XRE-family HTH domain
LGCPSQPQKHLCVAFFPLRLRAPRIPPLPRGYPKNPTTLGEHLRRRRLDLGLRQRDLARRLRVTEETLGLWERGLAQPLARHYGAITRFLGYDPTPAGTDLTGRLNAVRRRLGLTLKELAGRTGFDEGSLTRWLNRSRRPSRWMAGRLQAALDRLEGGDGAEGLPGPSFLELTRWKRSVSAGAVPATFGERLRRRRLRCGLSMDELARRAGISRAMLYRLERGEREPSAELRRTLRRVLRESGA